MPKRTKAPPLRERTALNTSHVNNPDSGQLCICPECMLLADGWSAERELLALASNPRRHPDEHPAVCQCSACCDERTALRDDSAPTVAAYFEAKLGRPLRDEQTPDPKRPRISSPYHPRFDIETGCGESCKVAIDAAATFVASIREAFAENSRAERDVIYACEAVVLCFVYG